MRAIRAKKMRWKACSNRRRFPGCGSIKEATTHVGRRVSAAAQVEAGLPLGIAQGIEYAESVVHGERFTFVSVGVVEAENPQRVTLRLRSHEGAEDCRSREATSPCFR